MIKAHSLASYYSKPRTVTRIGPLGSGRASQPHRAGSPCASHAHSGSGAAAGASFTGSCASPLAGSDPESRRESRRGPAAWPPQAITLKPEPGHAVGQGECHSVHLALPPPAGGSPPPLSLSVA